MNLPILSPVEINCHFWSFDINIDSILLFFSIFRKSSVLVAMYSMVAIWLPILLTSQVFCQTRERNDTIDAYNDINDIIYESSGEDYVDPFDYFESLGEDYVGDINPKGGNDITYESSADDDYTPDKVLIDYCTKKETVLRVGHFTTISGLQTGVQTNNFELPDLPKS